MAAFSLNHLEQQNEKKVFQKIKGSPPPLTRLDSDFSLDERSDSLHISSEKTTDDQVSQEDAHLEPSDLDTTGSTVIFNRL